MDQEIYHSILCLAAGINVLIAFVLIYTNFWYRNYTDYHRTRLLVALCHIVFSLCFIAYAWLGSDDMWLTGVVLSGVYFVASLVVALMLRSYMKSVRRRRPFGIRIPLVMLLCIGSIFTVVFYPDEIWPYSLLTTAGVVVFSFIFYVLTEYGSIVEERNSHKVDWTYRKENTLHRKYG